ncbi:MAG TPA: retention module-containing protein, partial [Accumulibacter sp.]|nr:retention module-containing protein [Accumulibacter sp.]HND80893.1 retention module-containing protein [Accumulibacter sp.]HNE13608.1 retention module-containing protein [Accumulibacter sp.]HNG39774.1 retention module-containing protein [Accumulibacter sp.]HNI74508.1 retention module-containing protein [Accumulibacter sp.]
MADNTPIARVSAIQGRAFVKEPDGSLRPLRVGDTIYEGEVVVTVGPRSHVDLATPDGVTHVLRGNETLTADAESVAAIKADATDAALTGGTADINRVIQTINQGGNLDELLEETAAGAGNTAGGSGADGGPSFVRLMRVAESVDPLAFEFGTTRTTTTDEGTLGLAGPATATAAATTPPSLTVSAPDNTNDSTPTITGTTDAPAGNTVTLVVSQGATSQTITATVQTDGTYSATVPVALAEGSYTVSANVTDAAGNTGTNNDSGSIDTSAPDAPVVTITEDANNDGTLTSGELSGTVGVSVALPAGAVAGDVLTVSGQPPITLTAAQIAAGTLTFEYPRPADGATLSITATLTDAAGNVSAPGSDSATVGDTSAPTISVSAPDNTNDSTPT